VPPGDSLDLKLLRAFLLCPYGDNLHQVISCGHCLTVAKHDSPHNPLPSPYSTPSSSSSSASISPVAAAGLRSRSSSSEVVPSVWTALEQL
jgi:hypothetical protein